MTRTSSHARPPQNKFNIRVQRNTDTFQSTESRSTKTPTVMKQYVQYMRRETLIREDELEDDIAVVIPHVPLPRKVTESSDTNNLNNDTHYGYSLQELRDKDMSLGDLFGTEHPEGFLVIRYKDDKKWLQQHREHQELRAERARAELLSNESDTNESVDGQQSKARRRRTKRRNPHVQPPAYDDSPSEAPTPVDVIGGSAMATLMEQMNRMQMQIANLTKAVDEEKKKAEEERLKNEEERKLVEADRKKAELERETAAEERAKQASEVKDLQEEVEFLRASNRDTNAFISSGSTDGEALRRIRLRNLLDRTQSKLAYYANLVNHTNAPDGSRNWRIALQSFDTTEDKIQHAKSLISSLDYPQVAIIFDSPEAARMAVEHPSKIRLDGDAAAHHHGNELDFKAAVEYHRHAQQPGADGLSVFVDFVFADFVRRH